MTYRTFLLFCYSMMLSGLLPGSQVISAQDTKPQQPVLPPITSAGAKTGSILGIVFDSLHGRPLSDAAVTVVQLPRKSVMTAPNGAFRIDSLPPGTYTLEILHSVLDSIGIRVVSDSIRIVGEDIQTSALSIPSAEVVVSQICPALQKKLGPGAIMGQVLDAESGTPMVGAEVSVAWFETELDPKIGVRTTPRVRKSIVSEAGTFRICGVPKDLYGSIQAILKDAVTGEIDVMTNDELLTIRFLRLSKVNTAAVTGDTSSPRALLRGQGAVSGKVTNQGGVPIAGARVIVNGSTARTTSAADGTFTLNNAPTGTQVIDVRQVGYLPKQLAIDISKTSEIPTPIRLDATNTDAVKLAGVDVREKAVQSALDRAGFTKRKGRENGRFFTQEDIAKIQPVMTSDILRRVPGLYVVGSGQNVTVVSSRGNTCVRYMIDGHSSSATQGVTIDEFVNPTDISAIEFYQANNVPMTLQNAKIGGCALVVVWTKAQVRSKSDPRS